MVVGPSVGLAGGTGAPEPSEITTSRGSPAPAGECGWPGTPSPPRRPPAPTLVLRPGEPVSVPAPLVAPAFDDAPPFPPETSSAVVSTCPSPVPAPKSSGDPPVARWPTSASASAQKAARTPNEASRARSSMSGIARIRATAGNGSRKIGNTPQASRSSSPPPRLPMRARLRKPRLQLGHPSMPLSPASVAAREVSRSARGFAIRYLVSSESVSGDSISAGSDSMSGGSTGSTAVCSISTG